MLYFHYNDLFIMLIDSDSDIYIYIYWFIILLKLIEYNINHLSSYEKMENSA